MDTGQQTRTGGSLPRRLWQRLLLWCLQVLHWGRTNTFLNLEDLLQRNNVLLVQLLFTLRKRGYRAQYAWPIPCLNHILTQVWLHWRIQEELLWSLCWTFFFFFLILILHKEVAFYNQIPAKIVLFWSIEHFLIAKFEHFESESNPKSSHLLNL